MQCNTEACNTIVKVQAHLDLLPAVLIVKSKAWVVVRLPEHHSVSCHLQQRVGWKVTALLWHCTGGLMNTGMVIWPKLWLAHKLKRQLQVHTTNMASRLLDCKEGWSAA